MSDWMDELREEKRRKRKVILEQVDKVLRLHGVAGPVFLELKQTVEQYIPILNQKVFDGESRVKLGKSENITMEERMSILAGSGDYFTIELDNLRYLVWSSLSKIQGELQSLIPSTGIFFHRTSSTLLSVEVEGNDAYIWQGGKKPITVEQIAQQLLSTLVKEAK